MVNSLKIRELFQTEWGSFIVSMRLKKDLTVTAFQQFLRLPFSLKYDTVHVRNLLQ